MSLNPPVPDRDETDPNRFGTVAFYAALGRAFVAMCGVVVGLFLIEVINHADGDRLNDYGGIRPHHLEGWLRLHDAHVGNVVMEQQRAHRSLHQPIAHVGRIGAHHLIARAATEDLDVLRSAARGGHGPPS